ncbi:Scr1 family TA system antitoxin-like transcriptional regulator [Streptomyces virginiae]|uniref:Scr1 family TA system antitoxin-like transcriptional regulator n=1 Tax=Streptomyces virginiae TaxID=1961 RepID=UPI002256986B|nr:Scr1 family TA system antitoxin-like transcriptional regulator [Streptomyces virginiae]MCX5271737.1 helix-turn-helix transcriptional regulator [Streptomyces virginiae]
MSQNEPGFNELPAAAEHSAVHLELRDSYGVGDGSLREDAEPTGHELALRCGWSPAKSSRIERAKTPASAADIRAWCKACEAEDRTDDLIAANRQADQMYVHRQKLHRHGMRRAQEEVVPLYEQTRHFRVYGSNVVPGMLQTEASAAALLSTVAAFQGTPDDSQTAAESRIERSRVLHEGSHRFALLPEEAVLRDRIGDASAMAGQLGHLPAVMAPSEVATYAKAFSELSELAVCGAPARALVSDAITSLGQCGTVN